MERFENKLIRGIPVSIYVASWYMAGGKTRTYKIKFDQIAENHAERMKDWLRTLVIGSEHLTEDEVNYIYDYARTGNSELKESAWQFLRNS